VFCLLFNNVQNDLKGHEDGIERSLRLLFPQCDVWSQNALSHKKIPTMNDNV